MCFVNISSRCKHFHSHFLSIIPNHYCEISQIALILILSALIVCNLLFPIFFLLLKFIFVFSGIFYTFSDIKFLSVLKLKVVSHPTILLSHPTFIISKIFLLLIIPIYLTLWSLLRCLLIALGSCKLTHNLLFF